MLLTVLKELELTVEYVNAYLSFIMPPSPSNKAHSYQVYSDSDLTTYTSLWHQALISN